MIIKVCKKHGDLTADQVRLCRDSRNGNLIARCMICRTEAARKKYATDRDAILRWQMAYHYEHKEKRSASYKAWVERLPDAYIIRILCHRTGLKKEDIPPEMIRAKRAVMLLKRALKESKS